MLDCDLHRRWQRCVAILLWPQASWRQGCKAFKAARLQGCVNHQRHETKIWPPGRPPNCSPMQRSTRRQSSECAVHIGQLYDYRLRLDPSCWKGHIWAEDYASSLAMTIFEAWGSVICKARKVSESTGDIHALRDIEVAFQLTGYAHDIQIFYASGRSSIVLQDCAFLRSSCRHVRQDFVETLFMIQTPIFDEFFWNDPAEIRSGYRAFLIGLAEVRHANGPRRTDQLIPVPFCVTLRLQRKLCSLQTRQSMPHS